MLAHHSRSLRLAAVAALASIGAASCSDDATAKDPGIQKADRTTTTEKRHELVATDASTGGTLTGVVGDRIRVVLVGGSWTFEDTSDPSTVRPVGDVERVPASDTCGTGGECGRVTARFEVRAEGTAEIRAARADCTGAEPGCTTGSGAFTLTVVAAG